MKLSCKASVSRHLRAHSPFGCECIKKAVGSVPDWERASPLLHPRESAWVGSGPGWERASPLPPPRFGVRLGPELGTGLFYFTPPCRRGALSRVENGPRLSHPPTCFGGGLGSGLGTGLSSFAPPCRLSAPSRIENGPLLLCASLTSVRSPRAGYYQHAALGRLRSGTNSERLSRTSALYNKPRARTARLPGSAATPTHTQTHATPAKSQMSTRRHIQRTPLPPS